MTKLSRDYRTVDLTPSFERRQRFARSETRRRKWGRGGVGRTGRAAISDVNCCTVNRMMHKCFRGAGRRKKDSGDARERMRRDVTLRRKCVVVKRYARRILCHNM